jgi:hypothetical protein
LSSIAVIKLEALRFALVSSAIKRYAIFDTRAGKLAGREAWMLTHAVSKKICKSSAVQAL